MAKHPTMEQVVAKMKENARANRAQDHHRQAHSSLRRVQDNNLAPGKVYSAGAADRTHQLLPAARYLTTEQLAKESKCTVARIHEMRRTRSIVPAQVVKAWRGSTVYLWERSAVAAVISARNSSRERKPPTSIFCTTMGRKCVVPGDPHTCEVCRERARLSVSIASSFII